MGDGLERARRQVKRLGRLVTNLLDVSRISAYRLELELDETDLVATVREVVEQFGPELTAGRLRSDACRRRASLRGRWDASRLGQVLTNLLSNACKYGARRPIEVTLARDGRTRPPDACATTASACPRANWIRSSSCSAGPPRARPFSGLGLGLYVSRKVVEAHGGNIQARPAPDQGAIFQVELPLELGTPPHGNDPAPVR